MTEKSTSVQDNASGITQSLALQVEQNNGESAEKAIARAKLNPSIQGAITVATFANVLVPCLAATDTNAVVSELKKQAKAVNANDLSRLEDMLTVQAHSLDAIFNECARRARLNIIEYPEAFDRYMKVGLKAQSQCRTTIEALAEIKNPRPFLAVGQANVAHGPQQVNNGISAPVRAPAPARENADRSNELLEHQGNGTRLEQGTSSLTGIEDSTMASVGEVNGTAHR
jgi:hypothetical protein